MRKAVILAAVLGIGLVLGPNTAQAAHNTVTVTAPAVVFSGLTTWTVDANVRINNTTAGAQSGQVTLYLLRVEFDGKITQLQKQDLGAVSIPGGVGAAAAAIPVRAFVHQPGTYLLFADVATLNVPHTHSGTIQFVVN